VLRNPERHHCGNAASFNQVFLHRLRRAKNPIYFCNTKKLPLSGRPEQGRKTPKPDRKKAAKAKRGGGKGKTVFQEKTQEVESRVKAGKTRRRQTRHLSIFRASKICFSLATSLYIQKT